MTTPGTVVALSHTGLWSGAETVLVRCLSWLGDEGWGVTLACPDGVLRDRVAPRGFRVVPVPDLKLPSLPRPVAVAVAGTRGLLAGRRLAAAARDADLVIVNGLLGLPALWAARRMGLRAPALWIVHDVIHQGQWLALLGRVRSAVDLAVAVSEASAGPVAGTGVRTVVVPNGTPWPVEGRTDADRDGPLVLGCAAALTPWKGQDVLLDAVARLDRDDVRLELAGAAFPKDADYEAALRARAEQDDLRGRVAFLGRVEAMAERMRTWDIAVSSSVDPEAAPLSVLEYLSVGLPVVATDHGGTSEVLAAADVGIGVAPGDASALADGLAALLDDADRRRRLGARGRALIAERFTLDHQRERFLSVVEDLRRDGRRPPGGR